MRQLIAEGEHDKARKTLRIARILVAVGIFTGIAIAVVFFVLRLRTGSNTDDTQD